MQLAYRGASDVNGTLLTDATSTDVYGTCVRPGDQERERHVPEQRRELENGAVGDQWIALQVRLSFISNAETLLTPSLSALGFAFRK